jgi:hypothetical protein
MSSSDTPTTALEREGATAVRIDPRLLPEPDAIGGAVADISDALVATLRDTRLEPDLDDLLWSTVNLFHRAIDRVQSALDDNEDARNAARRSRMARKSARSSSNACSPRG